jgi:hypothetical protein
LQYTDQKKLYIALLGILQRSGRGQLVDETLKVMAKKFGGSCKVRGLRRGRVAGCLSGLFVCAHEEAKTRPTKS